MNLHKIKDTRFNEMLSLPVYKKESILTKTELRKTHEAIMNKTINCREVPSGLCWQAEMRQTQFMNSLAKIFLLFSFKLIDTVIYFIMNFTHSTPYLHFFLPRKLKSSFPTFMSFCGYPTVVILQFLV